MKNIGLLVQTIGNGHFTQACTLYDILKEHYNIPLVVSCGPHPMPEWKQQLPNPTHHHEKRWVTENDIQGMKNAKPMLHFMKSICQPIDVDKYVKQYNLDLLISLWCPSIVESASVPWLSFAPQNSVNDLRLKILINLCKHKQIPVSIGMPNLYNQYTIPSLISDVPLQRHLCHYNAGVKQERESLCVAYAVSGVDFQHRLSKIAAANPHFSIHFFFKHALQVSFPSNVVVHKPSKQVFQNYLQAAACVLCTAGNELIQECAFNKIPVATMPCSAQQFEQVSNAKVYISQLKYAVPLCDELSLDALSTRRVNSAHQHIKASIQGREQKIVQLVESFITT